MNAKPTYRLKRELRDGRLLGEVRTLVVEQLLPKSASKEVTVIVAPKAAGYFARRRRGAED